MSNGASSFIIIAKRIAVSALLILLLCPFGISQSFHRALNNPENLFSQRILRNSDGSYFIGDSYLTNGEIYISRFFKCGALDWSRSYQTGGAFIEFRDFEFTSTGDLVAFGSYFVANKELIFIQKVNQNSGVQISFSTMDPVYQDHFTYSIDILDEEIMLFGLLLDFGIDRRGFVIVLDESFNIKWAKNFIPFEKEGEAIIGHDGFYCRSEVYHIKLDGNGDVLWTKIFDSSETETIPIGGPVKAEGGNIYEASNQGQNFFYKLDEVGNLIWKSEMFSTTGVRSAINELNNQNFLITYYGDVENRTVLAQMELSATGLLSNQRYFDTPSAFASGTVQVSIFDDITTIVGSPEPFTNFQDAYQDFIIQQHSMLDLACYESILYNDLQVNTLDLILNDFSIDILDFEMQDSDASTITVEPYEIGFMEICSDVQEPELKEEIFQLQCGASIELKLPNGDFKWDDLRTSGNRSVSEPGTYSARSTECENTEEFVFIIESPNCDCSVFFPTAISPNQDGFNDELEYFSDCNITEVDISIYNRWGERIFKNNVVGQFWQAENVSSGVYILRGSYQVAGPNGMLTKKELSQSVTVLK